MRIALVVAVLWLTTITWASTAPEIVYHASLAMPSGVATDVIESTLDRLRTFARVDVFREFSERPASVRLARRILAQTGMRAEVETLAELIRLRAKPQIAASGALEGGSVVRIDILDKAVARHGDIPPALLESVQYRQRDDVLLIKDTPERWILAYDSSDLAVNSREIWIEALRDHECLTMARMGCRRAFRVYAFLLDLVDEEFELDSRARPDAQLEAAAGIAVAWSATALICGRFDADRALDEWTRARPDVTLPKQLRNAGGVDALKRRFRDWSRDPGEVRRICAAFVIRN